MSTEPALAAATFDSDGRIIQAHHRCWTITHGSPFIDSEPHFSSHGEALAEAENAAAEAEQLAEPCWMAFTVCGVEFDEEGDGTAHFLDEAQARKVLASAEYRFGADGLLRCPEAFDCDLCDAVGEAPDAA